MSVLSLREVSKSFHISPWKTVQILNRITLNVEAGEVFALVGPNGSGKTTLISLIMCRLHCKEGEIRLFDQPATTLAARKRVGFMPEMAVFPGFLDARSLLTAVCEIYELPKPVIRNRVRESLKQVGLDPDGKASLRHYSKGMNKRLALAQALVVDPDLLILDEPMDGLDPVGMHFFRGIILELKKRGKTIFFTSHLLAEVEKLADRAAFLKAGTLICNEPILDLIEQGSLEAKYLNLMEVSL